MQDMAWPCRRSDPSGQRGHWESQMVACQAEVFDVSGVSDTGGCTPGIKAEEPSAYPEDGTDQLMIGLYYVCGCKASVSAVDIPYCLCIHS